MNSIDDPDELPMPESVRTPGRTWTELHIDDFTPGEGAVHVECDADAVEIESLAASDRDPFEALDADANRITAHHARALRDGVLVRVPSGAAAAEPVEITTTIADGFYPHHVVVVVEDGASARVVERNRGAGTLDSGVAEVVVGDDATLDYTLINELSAGTGYRDSHARVGENGTIVWTVLSLGADTYRNTTTTDLAGPRSTLAYDLGFLAADDQHMDITSHVVHGADNTRCDMDSRGVALDASRAIYKGVQEVSEDAEGTKSFQDEKTILIGDEAEADTTPQLQIDNSDVEATHAATTGHIDVEDLFYMTSRGLSPGAARREIITGMFDDLLEGGAGEDAVHDRIAETLA